MTDIKTPKVEFGKPTLTEIPRQPDAKDQRIAELETALDKLSELGGDTLLGCAHSLDKRNSYPHCCPTETRRAHEIGAYRAFMQAADIANAALAKQEDSHD